MKTTSEDLQTKTTEELEKEKEIAALNMRAIIEFEANTWF